ncbi:olfactory receptor 5AP2-like [Pleurodeles waltl]|uniref:olfactory receptor 5AP2-like n=1 Tax=Pleurodeles waltl TaxID=8319 RepID=UPI0037099CDA
MQERNWTSVTQFILLGLTDDSLLEVLLFIFFTFIYITTVLGNIGIIALITFAPRLHTPMYIFLSSLSIADLCHSSAITPKMLANLLSETKMFSFNACLTQLFFFGGFSSSGGLLLSLMAYDRYNAVCNPLLYSVIMTTQICIQLIVVAYSLGFLNSVIHLSCLSRLHFCGPNKISQFYCDYPPLFKLSCTDTTINEILIFTVAGAIEVGSLVIVLISYTFIISTILRIRSVEGKLKAFSTCASHFVSVTLLYIPVLFMYLRPSSSYRMEQDKVASVFYTMVVPMLNPIIYSMRNEDVKSALLKLTKQMH